MRQLSTGQQMQATDDDAREVRTIFCNDILNF